MALLPDSNGPTSPHAFRCSLSLSLFFCMCVVTLCIVQPRRLTTGRVLHCLIFVTTNRTGLSQQRGTRQSTGLHAMRLHSGKPGDTVRVGRDKDSQRALSLADVADGISATKENKEQKKVKGIRLTNDRHGDALERCMEILTSETTSP